MSTYNYHLYWVLLLCISCESKTRQSISADMLNAGTEIQNDQMMTSLDHNTQMTLDAQSLDMILESDRQISDDMSADMQTSTETDQGVFPPYRTTIWVCDSRFGMDMMDNGSPEALNGLNLNSIADDQGSIRIIPSNEACSFTPTYVDSQGNEFVLGEEGTYLFAAGAVHQDQLAICLSHIKHQIAEVSDENADPMGVMLRRQSTGISVLCTIRHNQEWIPLTAVIPETLDFAAWVASITVQADMNFQLIYQRDSSLNPLNLTTRDRPAEDGMYYVNFKLNDQNQIEVIGPTTRSTDIESVTFTSPNDPCLSDDAINLAECQPRCGDNRCDDQEQCADSRQQALPACWSDCGPCSLLVDDADEPEYSEIAGEWLTSRGHEGYSRFTSDTNARALFQINGLKKGWKKIAVQHPLNQSNGENIQYSLMSNNRLLGQKNYSQKRSREGWNDLGYFWSQGDVDLLLQQAGSGQMRTDAIKVDIAEQAPSMIDDGDFLFQVVEGTWNTVAIGHQNDYQWSLDGKAQFNFYQPAGWYKLAVYLPAVYDSSSTSNVAWANYQLLVNDQLQASFTLDQSKANDDWVTLGTYFLSGQHLSLGVEGFNQGPVLADAMRIEKVNEAANVTEQSVTTTQPLYREVAEWRDSAQGRSSNDPNAKAIYTVGDIGAQHYYLVAQYPVSNDNTRLAEYVVTTHGRTLARFQIDQSLPFETEWQLLGEVVIDQVPVEIEVQHGESEGILQAGDLKLIAYDCEACRVQFSLSSGE